MATKKTVEEAPAIGTRVAYFLRTSPVPEWVPAEVIDSIDGAQQDPPYGDDQVHLKVFLDRKRHHSSRVTGYRLNVERGDQPGQWLPEKPEDADEAYAAALQEYETRERINKENARKKPGE
jgi:hypothetical protein